MSDDSFVREVNEDLRNDQMKALWNRFGNIVIAVALLVVLGTAGWRGWEWWRERQAAQYGDAFLSAVEQADAGKQDDAVAALEELARSGSGQYPALARLRIAGETLAKGDKPGAIGAFDAIANDNAFEEAFRSVARLRAGLIAVDTETYEQVKARLEPMASAGQPYRSLAREGLGLSAFKAGANEDAAKWFREITQDADASGGVRERATLMLDLLAGKGVATGAS
ncbi:MAG TPA: tetratricopeptide repeat protein [Rhizobiaceae bacterium]|nr:tetratricopeptide repeat protein [Rhizobiaceae bacterium]